MGLSMDYSAGLTIDVIQDTAEDRLMEFTRKVNSDLIVEVVQLMKTPLSMICLI